MQNNSFSSNPAVRCYANREYRECVSSVEDQLPQISDEVTRNYLMLVRGNALLQLGQNQQAKETYFLIYRNCRLLNFEGELAEISSRALLNAGLATKNMGDMKTAIHFYRQALAEGYIVEPADVCRVHNMLGNALITIDPDNAREHLQQAHELALHHELSRERLLVQLNIIDYHIRKKEYQEAQTLLSSEMKELSAEPFPDIAFRCQFNEAVLFNLQGQHKRAIPAIRKLLQDELTAKDEVHLLTYLGLSQHALQRDQAAARSLEKARQLAEELEMDLSFLENACRTVLDQEQTQSSQLELANTLFHRHGMIGVSTLHQRLLADIDSLADASSPLLITGETGTGKELVARALHNASLRKQKPFIPVNCPAIPESLFESILFGHKKGSFTGASEDRIGLIETAADGTLFFDEFGDLPLSIQPKLLRFLESGEYTVMGSQQVKRSPARIISATNRNLEELIKSARFRQDLLQRISVFRIHVYPLRDHSEDVYFLASGFLDSLNEQYGTRKTLSADAVLMLERNTYSGNVRELRNLILRGYQKVRTLIEPEHLVLNSVSQDERPDAAVGLDQAVADFERQFIVNKLQKYEGERTLSARELGISLRSLKYKLQKLGIDSRSFKPRRDRKR